LKNLFWSLPVVVLLFSCSTSGKITYREDDVDIVNPERGFYIPIDTRASHFILLDTARLKRYRESPQQPSKATYKVQVTLIYRGYELDSFKDKPVSDEFLNSLQRDFDAMRAAGLKMIIRFAYTNHAKSGNCKDEYKICPPYGDASIPIVFQHIEQLRPLLQKNADVIALMQEGFIGIWGENYFTDYFGCASENGTGKINDSDWEHRNEVLRRLLNALPKDRMIQVRTPQIKQKYVYGPSAPVNSAPLNLAGAFNKSDNARIGFHNDCFLSSADDYGTYFDNGSSTQPKQPATDALRKYIEEDTRFTVVGGETCDDAFSPQNDCEPAGHAETEMRSMHYSFLNAAYNNNVNNDWDSMGCMRSIKQKLGYRLVLRNAILPKKIKKGEAFKIEIELENKGYAAPFNPRPVQLVLRNILTSKVILFDFDTEIQKWFTGKISLKQNFSLPADIPTGKYELLINFPDGYKSLQSNPAYSIRLANDNSWEEVSGFNKLNFRVSVD
jgi:hypothetical protein